MRNNPIHVIPDGKFLFFSLFVLRFFLFYLIYKYMVYIHHITKLPFIVNTCHARVCGFVQETSDQIAKSA